MRWIEIRLADASSANRGVVFQLKAAIDYGLALERCISARRQNSLGNFISDVLVIPGRPAFPAGLVICP
jgi:hypothetical protein